MLPVEVQEERQVPLQGQDEVQQRPALAVAE
jgi:hypothetical protein